MRAKFEVKTSAATGTNSLPFKTRVNESKAEEQSMGKNCPVSFIKDGAQIGGAQTDENGFARAKIPADEFEILIDGGLAHEKRIKFTANKDELKSAESNASSDVSSVKFDESEEDFGAYALKFILAFLGIGLFFGGIYLVKRGK